MSDTTKIQIPEGATQIEVNFTGEKNYPMILKFNDKKDTHHYWLENFVYDGEDIKKN